MAQPALKRDPQEFTSGIATTLASVGRHRRVVEDFFSPSLVEELDKLAATCATCLDTGGKLMLCGNGGSAADAQHIAAEFTGRFIKDRRALAAIALTTDTSALTAIANDYGYDEVFSRQVAALGQSGDVLIGISTSGNSANIIEAFSKAEDMGLQTVALLGKDGGKAKMLAQQAFTVPNPETARIQECHILFLHILCELVEQKLGL